MPVQYLTAKQVAERLGENDRSVCRLYRSGALIGFKGEDPGQAKHRIWYCPDSVEKYATRFDGILSDREWRDVVGYEGRYRVSEYGDIFALGKHKRLCVPRFDRQGYVRISLRSHAKQTQPVTWKVHQLVAKAWIGPCPDGLCTCHWDDNRRNNHYTNLRYATNQANQFDAIRNGRDLGRRLDAKTIREVKRLAKLGKRPFEIARATGVSAGHCYDIARGKFHADAR